MTRRRAGADTPKGAAKAAAVREAKGSVHEAIGKLIGDDAAEARGTAARRAAAEDVRDMSAPRPGGGDQDFQQE